MSQHDIGWALTAMRNHGGKVQTLELWKEVFGRSFVIEE